MTLEELRAAVVDKLGLLENDHFLTDASLNRSINNGLNRMAAEFPWPWLVATADLSVGPDDSEYDLPDDAVRIVAVSIEDEELDAVTMRGLIRSFNSRGRPRAFAKFGNTIRIAPKPVRDETLTVVYVRSDGPLVDDADEVSTPAAYTDVIVTYAALDQAIRLKDQAIWNMLEENRKQWIKSISDETISSTKPPMIQTRDDF